jgi:GNAT superfamily N-acetyltransferase
MPVIQTFSPEHAEGVVRLILPIQQQEFGIAITAEAQPDLRDIPGFYQRGAGTFWVALDGGEVVGSIALLDIGNAQAALRKMFVRASHRGREHGVAAALLAVLLEHARTHGLRKIFLGTTDKFLAAHRFYEKHGFAAVPREALPAAFPVMAVDSVFYALRLSPVPGSA